MLKNINERTLSKKFNAKVRSFPGASIGNLFDDLKPLLKQKLNKIILVIGTNDVERDAAQSIIKEMKALVQFIQEMFPHYHVVISEIFKRADKTMQMEASMNIIRC